ncbi:hypothetical protein A2U01_0055903, partial [Trifolium medium]|nr:hypothetical protein [Trifolium medium]
MVTGATTESMERMPKAIASPNWLNIFAAQQQMIMR